tara:strand:+ start:2142 stop:2564 length:423 start_codon:yes stop_codon:yes gene_type:complete
MSRVWMGGIFLKDEGGYEIVLKSLEHYKKRLQTIHQSPELKETAAMFAPVLQSQAQKRLPMIETAKQKIDQVLHDTIPAQSLEEDLEILENAINCHRSDIDKAENTGDQYFVKLLGDLKEARNDLDKIQNASVKIKEYSN